MNARCDLSRRLVRFLVFSTILMVPYKWAEGINWDQVPIVEHSAYQAVNADGSCAYSGSFPIRMRGVILNNPEKMHDNTANYNTIQWNLGGQWEIFCQSTEPNDVGGTASWMGQNYGNLPFIGDPTESYSNAEWEAELDRLNHDPATGHNFRAGDLVEIRAVTGLHYKGKMNINEEHTNDPSNNFEVHLLQAGYGLPDPIEINLTDVKDSSNNCIFDHTRNSGGELYQSQMVRLKNVHIADATNWQSGGSITVTNDGGQTLPIMLGLDEDFDLHTPPLGPNGDGVFDIIGIFDQVASNGQYSVDGYQMWVTEYNGNDIVLPEPAALCLLLAGGLLVTKRRWKKSAISYEGGKTVSQKTKNEINRIK